MNFYKRSGNRVAKLFCSTLCGSPAFNRLLLPTSFEPAVNSVITQPGFQNRINLIVAKLISTRRSKIVSRATGRYAATSFDQLLVCPRSSFAIVGVAFFFVPQGYSPFSTV